MRRLLAGALLLKLLFLAGAGTAATVSLGELTLQGSDDGGVEAYLGVPFVQPPVASLRWAPPQPLAHLPGTVVHARRFAPACEQGPHIVNWYRGVITGFGGDPATFPAPAVSEDCLYLNIWRPRGSGEPLPIIVYVHGGSNVGGWAYEPNYIGARMAAGGAVVISVAYRLGVFGFFAHPDVPVANFALLDLVAALQWIQHHATALGGDPARVTLMGESAGANNIAHLLAMPVARGLFHRIIHQSAGWAVNHEALPERRRELALALQRRLGAADLGAMREVPATAVREVAGEVFAGEGFGPVANAASLPLSYRRALQAASLDGVDLMIGSNADEARMYLDPELGLADWLAQNVPEAQRQAVRALLPAGAGEREMLDELASAEGYHCPSLVIAEANTRSGGRSWLYYFARVRPGDKAAAMGAYHGAELPYVFSTHDEWLPTEDADRELAATMMAYWLNFARSGDPNGAGLVEWPAYSPVGLQTMVLDSEIQSGPHPASRLCRALNNNNEGSKTE